MVAAARLYVIAQDGWSAYSMVSAFLFEMAATFIFVMARSILPDSRYPARSLGPALFAGGTALSQPWLYIDAPCIGGAAAGRVLRTDTFTTEQSAVAVQAA